jgi:hypothetical protein
MRKTIFFCLVTSMLFSISVFGQNLTVTGKVTGEDGSTLPGVSIALRGTTLGTTTNSEGLYSIEVPNNGILNFSFIGFETQQISVDGRSVINISLKNDVSQLNEVVVTALGIKRESRALGYSVARVEGSQLVRKSEPDPLKALQ